MAALVISKIYGFIFLYCDKEAKLDLGIKQKMILSPKPHTSVNPKPTTQALETKAQSSASPFNGNKSTDHVTPKGSLRTGHTAKEIQLSNRFETLGLCAVTC